MDALSQSADTDWKVGILLSDRPIHWERALKGGEWLEVPPEEIEVGPFSEAELDRLLAKHQKTRGDFAPKVLDINKMAALVRCRSRIVRERG
jgi:hypothetical protein